MLGKAFRERTGSLKRNVQFFECLLECVCIFSINHKLHEGYEYSIVRVCPKFCVNTETGCMSRAAMLIAVHFTLDVRAVFCYSGIRSPKKIAI